MVRKKMSWHLVLVVVWFAFVSTGHTTSVLASGDSILVGNSLESFKELYPHLKNATFTPREWRGTLHVPLIGVRHVVLPYFETNRTAAEMSTDPRLNQYAYTVIVVSGDDKMEVAVVTCNNSPNQFVVLADEAVNALLPQWLFERGVDMWEVIRKQDTDPYRFTWGEKTWTSKQLSEALSFVVSGQMIPAGYAGRQVKFLCSKLPSFVGSIDNNSYGMINFLVQQTKCDFSQMYTLLESALKVAMGAFPKRAP